MKRQQFRHSHKDQWQTLNLLMRLNDVNIPTNSKKHFFNNNHKSVTEEKRREKDWWYACEAVALLAFLNYGFIWTHQNRIRFVQRQPIVFVLKKKFHFDFILFQICILHSRKEKKLNDFFSLETNKWNKTKRTIDIKMCEHACALRSYYTQAKAKNKTGSEFWWNSFGCGRILQSTNPAKATQRVTGSREKENQWNFEDLDEIYGVKVVCSMVGRLINVIVQWWYEDLAFGRHGWNECCSSTR